ncbi:aminotransferase class I/II-fold pyridoxal phosphate-dependent enzyme [Rhodocaloribacter litoris]|uniref:threonine aldolase family protein n=1 Tax=Rhodocaloribacter litoris TaxID=2558931 RepID=UPI001422CC5E|nr:GntG family PLP-dependent aldolase [Rhodocaloribacter litoris]QXD14636.1 aminotransferase class I/II-fold pyridoxal phosphate-dependent enzyme [Rhodocaloribacter litoris]
MRIDLRSDTVTQPTEGMRRAMYEAEVGDDVFGEDPTVRRLEETVAALLGKEAALFVPSGTMGNQLALKVHTRPGDEVILERTCHIFNYESGAPGLLSGVVLHPLDGEGGILTGEQVAAAVRPGYYWMARSRLVCLENTLNQAGGTVYPLENVEAIAAVVRGHGLRYHLDGARLWNATAATGIPEHVYAAPFDTVNVCFSKGLGAPVGSALAGPKDLITEAHRYRKMFGGGMRQAGILAAAALYALEHHRPHLAEDHAKARRLAEGLAELPGFRLDPDRVQTNIVLFDVDHGDALRTVEELKADGILMVPFGPATVRATTHRDVSMEDIEQAIARIHRRFGN